MRRYDEIRRKTAASGIWCFPSEFPAVKGSLCWTHTGCVNKGCKLCAAGKGHKKLLYSYRLDGRQSGMLVRPQHEGCMNRAIENWHAIDRMAAEYGREYLMSLRQADDNGEA